MTWRAQLDEALADDLAWLRDADKVEALAERAMQRAARRAKAPTADLLAVLELLFWPTNS